MQPEPHPRDRPRGSPPSAATTVQRPQSHRTPVRGATSATAMAAVGNPRRSPPAWRKQGGHEVQRFDRGLPPSECSGDQRGGHESAIRPHKSYAETVARLTAKADYPILLARKRGGSYKPQYGHLYRGIAPT